MIETIQPGQWVRPLFVPDHAPMAGWRLLTLIGDTMWRWQKLLVFADGYQVGVHWANLALVDDEGRRLWETSEQEPAEVAS